MLYRQVRCRYREPTESDRCAGRRAAVSANWFEVIAPVIEPLHGVVQQLPLSYPASIATPYPE